MKSKALLYCANLKGHRQIYCDVFTDILLDQGWKVVLAIGYKKKENRKWINIDPYFDHPDVTIIDLATLTDKDNCELTATQIVDLQKETDADFTFFVNGDKMKEPLLQIARGQAPRLIGKTGMTFIHTKGLSLGMEIMNPSIPFAERFDLLAQLIFKKNPIRNFFREAVFKEKVVDHILIVHDQLAELLGKPFIWYPDIFKPFTFEETPETLDEYERVSKDYHAFLETQKGRDILLYFGAPAAFKGYDTLIRLAVEDEESCFVHCGSPEYGHGINLHMQKMAEESKDILRKQGRYFETGKRINGNKSVSVFFKSIKFFVSAHRLYSASGTILQALDEGKPVLAPDRDLLGYRIKQFNLGMVYKPDNFKSLKKQWLNSKEQGVDQYEDTIKSYMRKYGKEELAKVVKKMTFE